MQIKKDRTGVEVGTVTTYISIECLDKLQSLSKLNRRTVTVIVRSLLEEKLNSMTGEEVI